MWNQLKNTKKKFQFGDYFLCFPKEKNTYGQIQEKMVWSIWGIILLPNKIKNLFLLTILNQT